MYELKAKKQNASNVQNNKLVNNTDKISEALKRALLSNSITIIENFTISNNSGTIIFGNSLAANPMTNPATADNTANGAGGGNTGNLVNETTTPICTNYLGVTWTRKPSNRKKSNRLKR